MPYCGADNREMVRRRKEPVKLFIGEWIFALGMKASEVAKAAGYTEGYISQLITESETKNPSFVAIYRIAKAMGIPVDCLTNPPPAKDALAEMLALRLRPSIVNRLTRDERPD